MNLAIDIGNTRMKIGVFDGDQLVMKTVCETVEPEKIIELATNHNVENIILSTVAKGLNKTLIKILKEKYFFLELDEHTPLPVKNLYKTPATLGKDRLAAIVGAQSLSPGKNCLVIDAGSCITYDILMADGRFLGGNISPGVKMRLKAMHTFTENLPLPTDTDTDFNWGNSTETALLNGARLGTLLEMQGFIDLCANEFGKTNVFLTGGDAESFANKFKKKIFVHSNLVLIGLNKILNHNVEKK
ncbi:MAG: type III pantothenate kinase [Saprospiraceae bacterium]|nr:type III pantothenate kinase [Saprospiraceae bacterium]MCB9325785.1 type III pantothenate kinase [Lewinellaceae bacterium]